MHVESRINNIFTLSGYCYNYETSLECFFSLYISPFVEIIYSFAYLFFRYRKIIVVFVESLS